MNKNSRLSWPKPKEHLPFSVLSVTVLKSNYHHIISLHILGPRPDAPSGGDRLTSHHKSLCFMYNKYIDKTPYPRTRNHIN